MAKIIDFAQLNKIRSTLLSLHKLLLEYQICHFEKTHGRIKPGRAMFYIVSTEPAFAWLRQITELIVGIDGLVEAKSIQSKNYKDLLKYTKELLTPDKHGSKFSKQYYKAIQENPEVLIKHHQITTLLKNKKS